MADLCCGMDDVESPVAEELLKVKLAGVVGTGRQYTLLSQSRNITVLALLSNKHLVSLTS